MSDGPGGDPLPEKDHRGYRENLQDELDAAAPCDTLSGGERDPGRFEILLAGFGGMPAGAFSTAAGERVSMKSQRKLFERDIVKEAGTLTTNVIGCPMA